MERQFLTALANLDPESAEELEWRSTRWRDESVSVDGGRKVSRDSGESYGLSRQRVVDVLATRARKLGVSIRYEHEVRGTADLPGADLIVAAHGADSRLRDAAAFGTTVTEGRNKYIWLGTGRVFDSFNFFFEQTEAGWIWAYAYQHEPMASTFIVECEPQTWAGLGFDHCPPGRMLGRLEEIFAGHLGGRRLWTQFTDGTDASWLNFRTVSSKRWHHGNVVLVGDSAHTAHFSAGLGTTRAIEDVIALADQLRRADCRQPGGGTDQRALTAALTAYQKQRQAEFRPHAKEARRSAQWFENVPGYADLAPRQFATVLFDRRARLLPQLPPRLFCLLHDIRHPMEVVDSLRGDRVPAATPAALPPGRDDRAL
ncbi:MAG TPA: FAD-dependent monooxygenase [Trebonia sp.]